MKNNQRAPKKRAAWPPKAWKVLFLLVFMAGQAASQVCPLSYGNLIRKQSLSDSVDMAYAERGSGKITLLLVHGLGGNLSHWQPLLMQAGADYRMVAVDLPGYGFSTLKGIPVNADILAFYAQCLLTFIQKRKLKNVVLVGHSMGGQVAVVAALKKPEAIQKLVLAAPAGLETFTGPEAELLRRYATPQLYRNQDEKAVRNAVALNFSTLPPTAETLIEDRLRLRSCPQFEPYCELVSLGVAGMLAHPVRSQLTNLRQPVLLLFGAEDKLIPNRLLHPNLTTQGIAEQGKADIPNSRLVMIPNAGHLLMYEQPEAVSQALKAFLTTIP